MNDSILLTSIRLTCRLGVTPEERSTPQPVFIDVELQLNLARAAQSDSIADTVDYAAVRQTIHNVAAGREYALVETLAGHMAQAVLSGFPVNEITLTVSKPEALRQFGVANTAIRITRRRA